LFTSTESHNLPRGTSRVAVNREHNMIAVGWLDNKAVNFISTSIPLLSDQSQIDCTLPLTVIFNTKRAFQNTTVTFNVVNSQGGSFT
jgi:hypothetical protein